MPNDLQVGQALKQRWKEIADSTNDQWNQQFWNKLAKDSPLPNVEAYYQSHLILFDLATAVGLLLDSLERSGVDLSTWEREIAQIRNDLAKRKALSDMFSADWHSR